MEEIYCVNFFKEGEARDRESTGSYTKTLGSGNSPASIQGPMMSVCYREGVKIKPEALDQIIIGSNQDIRQVLHHLSMWSANEKNLQTEDMKREASKAQKNFKKVKYLFYLLFETVHDSR